MVEFDHYEYDRDGYYCYPGTNILKNKLNIMDEAELADVERKITAVRSAELMKEPLSGRLDFGMLKRIHGFLFGDIYEWAGKIRTVNISKGACFCRFEFIEAQMGEVMGQLAGERYLSGQGKKQISVRLAYYIGEINAVHPFREGNGRTQREFMRMLAARNGYWLDFMKISTEEMLEASWQTFNQQYERMAQLLFCALEAK